VTNHDNLTLAAAESLRSTGFAVHWLKAREKRPVGREWSTAPVATVEELRASQRPGFNIGLRTGEPSRTDAGYVHLFDMDIRVAELADEAWAAFAKLFPDIAVTDYPSVISGSGGESRHVYFVTDKPFTGKKLAVSDGKHRDAKGTWHYDWEIDLFGTGKQAVLPPSIHPDTGKPYIWEREFDFEALSFGIVPEIASSVIESLGVVETTEYGFESRPPLDFKPGQLERDLDAISISDLDYDDWVRLGQALHHQFGGSQEGFDLWLHHTKRSSKFGKKQTPEQQIREMRRIKWRSFGKYRGQPVTMGTVRQWAQEARLASLVDDDLDDLDDLDSDDGDDFADLLTDDDDDLDAVFSKGLEPKALDWTSLLSMTKDGDAIAGNLHNVELIVCNDPRLVGLIQLNEFTQETVQRTPPGVKNKRRKTQPKDVRQLEGRVWEVQDTLNGDLWSDDRDFAIRSIIEAPNTQGGYNLKVTDRDLKAAIVLAANRNAFHPVREYLNGLTWDGVSRVERLWIDYVKAPDDAYHRDVARMAMIAAVTRIFEPGHKFDFATILEGLQGKRKSTLISVLGRSWFAELDGEFSDQKQMIELMQGAWIMEIPELTGFSRADVRSIKAFISRQKDRARLAYARRAGSFPRQCIFIGSTNDREYLKDDTGGRRFWPVECCLDEDEEIDTDRLEMNVDQLWAEAVVLYREMRAAKPRGTLPLYLSRPESRTTAARLQESRRQETPADSLAGKIAEWLERPVATGSIDDEGEGQIRNETCSQQVWVECMGGDLKAFGYQHQQLVNAALAKVPGWAPAGSKRFGAYGKQRIYARGGAEGVLTRAGLGDL
jgi:predicted P-loop ATPase